MQTISFQAGNDGPPTSPRATSVEVSGSGFTPGARIDIRIGGSANPLAQHVVHASFRGSFLWDHEIKPQQVCFTDLEAVVDGDGVKLSATANVFCP